jgi:outer membrane lipopolysaccharide assembly protein LptE/RlpB
LRSLTVICTALILIGCGVYSFSGSSLAGIRTVAVPQFKNETVEYGIQEDLTAAVIEKLIADNTLKVVAMADADGVLRGEITGYDRVAYTYDRSDNVSEYKVNVTVDFVLEKKDGKAVIEKEGLFGFGIYDAVAETEDDGKTRAVEKLAQDIVDLTTRSW